MSYSKEQFIEDFKNAYNQSQQLHFIYRYVEDGSKNISSINFETVDHDVNTDVTIVVTLSDGTILRGNTIRVANDGLSGVVDTLQENVGALTDSVDDLRTNTQREINKIKNGTTHLFENITDRYGNPRFVEGNITMEKIEGVTQTYGKWSLSGTHLMIVLCISVVSGTTIHVNDTLTTIEVPDYVINKINPLASNLVAIGRFEGRKDITLISDNLDVLLRKDNENQILEIKKANNDKSYNRNLNFRIQFDLLIDDR